MGVVDTYSYGCHLAALGAGAYDVEAFKKKEADAWRYSGYSQRWGTSTGRMVFRCLSRRDGDTQPYVARSSIDGLFEPEPDESTSGLAAAEEMKRNPAFRRIDLEKAKSAERRPLPFEAFDKLTHIGRQRRSDGFENGMFPFRYAENRIFMDANGRWVKIANVSYRSDGRTSLDLFDVASKGKLRHGMTASPRDVYDTIRPTYPVLFYDNGEPVQPEFAAALVPAEVIDRSGGLW